MTVPERTLPPGLTREVCLQSSIPSQRSQGELHLQLIYKPYEDDEEAHDAYRERESFVVARQEAAITDVKSAAGLYFSQ